MTALFSESHPRILSLSTKDQTALKISDGQLLFCSFLRFIGNLHCVGFWCTICSRDPEIRKSVISLYSEHLLWPLLQCSLWNAIYLILN